MERLYQMLPIPKPSSLSLSNGTLFGPLLRRLSTTAASNEAEKSNHFMVDYLVKSCGLSSSEASKAASKYLSHLKSTEKPDSFLAFMRGHGFEDAQIRRIVSLDPRYLCKDVEKTLAPKFQSLLSMGFSASDLTSLIASNPNLLHYRVDPALLQRIKLWETLLGSRDALIKALKKQDFWLLRRSSVEESVVPNLSLLRNSGIPEEKIGLLLRKSPPIMTLKSEKFSALVQQVETMGIPKSSGMFIWGLYALSLVTKARLDANLELMKSFGWSEADFRSAFRRSPTFVAFPREMMSRKMNFLVKEVGLEPSAVASAPLLLQYSLEKRLVPRHRVVSILRSRKLLGRECKLVSIMAATDERFRKKYVTPFKDMVPELQQVQMVSGGTEDAP